jgi:hypothetical protein
MRVKNAYTVLVVKPDVNGGVEGSILAFLLEEY